MRVHSGGIDIIQHELRLDAHRYRSIHRISTRNHRPRLDLHVMQDSDHRGINKPKRERYHNVSD